MHGIGLRIIQLVWVLLSVDIFCWSVCNGRCPLTGKMCSWVLLSSSSMVNVGSSSPSFAIFPAFVWSRDKASACIFVFLLLYCVCNSIFSRCNRQRWWVSDCKQPAKICLVCEYYERLIEKIQVEYFKSLKYRETFSCGCRIYLLAWFNERDHYLLFFLSPFGWIFNSSKSTW